MFYNHPFAIWAHYMFHHHAYFTPTAFPQQNIDFAIPTQNYKISELFYSQAGQKEKYEQMIVKIQENLQKPLINSLKQQILFQEQDSNSLKKTIKNHNVLPNIVNSILSHIRRRSKTGKKVQKIMNKYKPGEDITYQFLSKYYAYQNYLHSQIPKSKHQNSMRFIITHFDPALKAFTPQQQLFYNKVSRILIYNLLQDEFLLNFLTNRKCSRSSKADHLRAKLFLITVLREDVNNLDSFEK